jgi:hypothetical protein
MKTPCAAGSFTALLLYVRGQMMPAAKADGAERAMGSELCLRLF